MQLRKMIAEIPYNEDRSFLSDLCKVQDDLRCHRYFGLHLRADSSHSHDFELINAAYDCAFFPEMYTGADDNKTPTNKKRLAIRHSYLPLLSSSFDSTSYNFI